MTDRPILFSGPMVRAILDGKKTQTRRVLKPQIETFDVAPGQPCAVDIAWDVDDGKGRIWKGSYQAGATKVGWKKGTGVLTTQTVPYAPGDRLWVRETWVASGTGVWNIAGARRHDAPDQVIKYAADGGDPPWWPSIHMPREFSRITLTVTEVRVQRLQDISEDDAIAEGAMKLVMEGDGEAFYLDHERGTHRCGFAGLWDHINGKREGANWDANPWVVAVSFAAEKRNIDADTDPAYTARLIGAASLDPL
jgi:hypothetical protein